MNESAQEPFQQLTLGTEFEAEVGNASLERHSPTIPGASSAPYSIQTVTLVNFKGFARFEINLGRFNVLVGANNSGKSTVLRAIRFGYELTKMHFDRTRGGLAEFLPGRSVPKSILPVAQLRDLWPAGRMRVGNTWQPSEVSLTLQSGHKLAFGIIGPWNAATSKIDPETLKAMNTIPGAIIEGFLARPPQFVPASIGIVAEEEFRTPARREALVATGRHNEVIRNYLADLTEGQRSYLAQLLERHFGVRVEVELFDQNKDQFISVNYVGGDGTHDLFSAGGGFLQVVEVLVFLLRGSPGVALLDEPDSHLHSGLQHALVDILEEFASQESIQVLLATHSKEIINYVDPSRIIQIDRKAPRASPLDQHTSTVTVLKELGAIDNVDAYQIVRQKALLIVEGPTDRELLPRLAGRLGSSLFEGSSRVSIVPARGVDRLSEDGELQLIEALLGKDTRTLRLRDRDAMTDNWKLELEQRAKRPFFIWPMDCLENYLLEPKAIHRIVLEEFRDPPPPPIEEIEEIITKALQGASEVTFDRVAARIQDLEWRVNHRRVNADEANPVARSFVESIWVQTDGPRRIARGKDVLALVRQAISTRYGVSFGNSRIIEAMTPDEIHQDVVRLLQEASIVLVPASSGT